MTEFVATSLARRLITRMQATHARRRISVFAGPPGVGKTTAIDEFAKRRPGEVVVVKIARRGAREVLALQHTLEALRRLTGSSFHHAPSSVWELRNDLFGAACVWADVDPPMARRGHYPPSQFPRLTVVFDEAQNLSREAIEALRYWNDADRCYAPFPFGLIFVGNNEFSLAGGAGDSVISAAVADRALFLQTFDYADVADEDLELFVETHCDWDASAIAAIVASFRHHGSPRSFRRVQDFIDDVAAFAGSAPVSADQVHHYLAAL